MVARIASDVRLFEILAGSGKPLGTKELAGKTAMDEVLLGRSHPSTSTQTHKLCAHAH